MNLLDLFVKISVDDQASSNLGGIASKIGSGLKTAAKIGTAAVAAAAGAVSLLTKQSLDGYAEYEQLVGGVETLFKQSADQVIEYANRAYETAGLSANEYMDTVTSFRRPCCKVLAETRKRRQRSPIRPSLTWQIMPTRWAQVWK